MGGCEDRSSRRLDLVIWGHLENAQMEYRVRGIDQIVCGWTRGGRVSSDVLVVLSYAINSIAGQQPPPHPAIVGA